MRVEIFADVLCPWCFIGKRRLAAALAQVADRDQVEVVWRSWELAPEQGRVPGPTAAEAMAQWWGERAPARVAHIQAVGSADGLELDLHAARPVSTFDAHRLIHLAAERGLADAMVERLLRGYHTEGLNVADQEVLARLGVEAGLDLTEVRALLVGDDHADSVRADERRAAEVGVSSVPSVVIDGRPPVTGVQPPAELHRLIERALTARS
ncbi:DsbA family oxidoreductase [Lentzea sp. NEAU-D13]|uniref:DsbA family oxidoreductase n=1 Tax=Lentzea alba TaxID=2714351 RepID=A0A7C9RRQ0_9PSEU|nr:DsbA family oxidoreductase [Lentzea alba]NGY60947.1 DsbA family oxidoreductase [Lentzea alba]